jgi:hypothetical protein
MFFFFNGSTTLVGLGRFYFSFLIYTRAVGLLERVISSSQGLYLNTRQHKHRKTHIHTIKHPCPKAEFEPAITASERSKTVHALDRSATATGKYDFSQQFSVRNARRCRCSLPRSRLYATRWKPLTSISAQAPRC